MGRFIVDDGSAGLSQSKLGMTIFGGLSTQGGLSATCANGEDIYLEGNVGIGTAAPANSLHVYGDGANGEIKAERSPGAAILTQAQAALGVFGTTSNHGLRFMTNNTGRVTITNTGNVGIGTTAPTTGFKLDVRGRLILEMGDPYIRLSDTSTSRKWDLHASSANVFHITDATAGTQRLTIDSSGNVGIGTTAPSSTAGSDTFLQIYGAVDAGIGIKTGNADWEFKNENPTGNLALYASGGSRVTFEEAGSVGIGTSAPASGILLHISDGANATFVRIGGTANTYNVLEGYDRNHQIILRGTPTNATTGYAQGNVMSFASYGGEFRWYKKDGASLTEQMRIDSSGKVGIGTTAPSRALDVGGHNDGMVLPVGTTAQRPTTYLSGGTMRFNSDLNAYEGYTGAAWGSLGGGNAFDGASVIRYNDQTLSESVTVGIAGSLSANGFTAGPITIEDGYTVTIEHGSNWTIF